MSSGLLESTKPFQRSMQQLNWAYLIPPQIGIASCAMGEPGIGKTKTVEALAKATERRFFTYELSKVQPEDLLGFPVVAKMQHDGSTYEYMNFVPDRRLLESSLYPSVILFDEITGTSPPKQSAALTVVQDPPAQAWMFMAGNPIESASDGQPLTCPFVNRIWHGEWQIDTEAQDHGLQHLLDYPPPEVPIVPENYMDWQPKWGNLITNYFKFHPKERNNCPNESAAKSKPWPSSRQWNNVSKCLAAAEAVGANEVTMMAIVEGLVGQVASQQFWEYVQSLSLPDPRKLIMDPKSYQRHGRYDVDIAIISSVINQMKKWSETDPETLVKSHDNIILLGETIEAAHGELAAVYWAGVSVVDPDLICKRILDTK